MKTILNIDGTDYDATSRAANRFVGIDELTLSVDRCDELAFTVLGCTPAPPFPPNKVVTLTTTDDDGSNSALRFKGDIRGPIGCHPSPTGWSFSYTCPGIRRRADYIPLRASDGSAVASYNLPLDDPGYLFTTAAMSVGSIVQAILTAPVNAALLTAAGIGGMTFSGGAYTLPAATMTDLALLTIAPNSDVRLQGEAILSILEQFIGDWHSQYRLWVRPDGIIRIASPFAFTSRSMTVPGSGSSAALATTDMLDWPEYSIDDSQCYTQYRIIGRDIGGAILSQVAGTLSPAWLSTDQSTWTISDFISPKGAADDGTCTVTSTSATVTSNHASVFWASGFWPSIGGIINLHNLAGAGIDIHANRQVTACTALTAGGSATISWDTSVPLDSTGYTTYQLVGANTAKALVSRLFNVREPASGAIGLATFIGSRLVPRFGRGGFSWANMQQLQVYEYPAAKVLWSQTGTWPWFEEPIVMSINPKTGQILLAEPAVKRSAEMANQVAGLANGYPTSYYSGLYYDIQCIVPYNRGDLTAYAPLPGAGAGGSDYQGTAYTKYGLQRIKYFPLDSFDYRGDLPAMRALAAEKLRCVCDVVVEGSIGHHGIPTSFDVFTLGYALRLSVGGSASELDGLDLPVRTVVIRWPATGADIHTVGFRFSNQMAPFSGDSLYIHPHFSDQGFGSQEGSVFVGGQVGGMSGVVDERDFVDSMKSSAQSQSSLGSKGGWADSSQGWNAKQQDLSPKWHDMNSGQVDLGSNWHDMNAGQVDMGANFHNMDADWQDMGTNTTGEVAGAQPLSAQNSLEGDMRLGRSGKHLKGRSVKAKPVEPPPPEPVSPFNQSEIQTSSIGGIPDDGPSVRSFGDTSLLDDLRPPTAKKRTRLADLRGTPQNDEQGGE